MSCAAKGANHHAVLKGHSRTLAQATVQAPLAAEGVWPKRRPVGAICEGLWSRHEGILDLCPGAGRDDYGVRRALHLNVLPLQTSESSRTPDALAPWIVAVKPGTVIRPAPVRGTRPS